MACFCCVCGSHMQLQAPATNDIGDITDTEFASSLHGPHSHNGCVNQPSQTPGSQSSTVLMNMICKLHSLCKLW